MPQRDLQIKKEDKNTTYQTVVNTVELNILSPPQNDAQFRVLTPKQFHQEIQEQSNGFQTSFDSLQPAHNSTIGQFSISWLICPHRWPRVTSLYLMHRCCHLSSSGFNSDPLYYTWLWLGKVPDFLCVSHMLFSTLSMALLAPYLFTQ